MLPQPATSLGIALDRTIALHGFSPIAESAGATPSTPLPTPDVTGVIAMSATSGARRAIPPQPDRRRSGHPHGHRSHRLRPDSHYLRRRPRAPVPTNSTAGSCTPAGRDANNNSTDFVAGAPGAQQHLHDGASGSGQTLCTVNNLQYPVQHRPGGHSARQSLAEQSRRVQRRRWSTIPASDPRIRPGMTRHLPAAIVRWQQSFPSGVSMNALVLLPATVSLG